MAHAAFRGIRRWARQQMQPAYNRLSGDEQLRDEEELKDETKIDVHLMGSESSSSASSPRPSDGFSPFSPEKPPRFGPPPTGISAIPILLLRLVHLSWLLVTAPITRPLRRLGSAWPPVYAALEEFKVLVPSFLKPSDPGPARKLHPTAWLDGLRGVAAFFVVCHHISLLFFSNDIHLGYASKPKQQNWLIQYPFLRLIVSGPPQVAIFFVISGYALSYKPLRLARQRRFSEAAEAINSSVFRRWPRLFLMPVCVTVFAFLMICFDLYGTEGWVGVAAPVRRPPRAQTLSGQLWNYILNVLNLTSLLDKDLRRGNRFGYDNNLWTLPVEFDMSLMLFLCLAAFNRLRPRLRLLLTCCIALYAHWFKYWHAFLFLAGMIICDLHFHVDGVSSNKPDEQAATPTRWWSARKTLAGFVGFVVALYVLSMPEEERGAATTPGYITLYNLIPAFHKASGNADYFWVPLAAAALVYAVDRTPSLQRLFTYPLTQYLGKISFSMYVIHGPLIWTVGHWTVKKTTSLTGTATQLQYGMGIALAAVVFWPIVICLADLAQRTLDVTAVNVGRRLYESMIQKEPEPVLPQTAAPAPRTEE